MYKFHEEFQKVEHGRQFKAVLGRLTSKWGCCFFELPWLEKPELLGEKEMIE